MQKYIFDSSEIAKVEDRIYFLQRDDKKNFNYNLDKSKFDINGFWQCPIKFFVPVSNEDDGVTMVRYMQNLELVQFLKLFDIFAY
jgi:hypothetical protein